MHQHIFKFPLAWNLLYNTMQIHNIFSKRLLLSWFYNTQRPGRLVPIPGSDNYEVVERDWSPRLFEAKTQANSFICPFHSPFTPATHLLSNLNIASIDLDTRAITP